MANKNKSAGVLVIGAGIAGVNAALELAGSGIKVYLCERKPYIGGALARLDRWFPANHCGMCQVLPVFDRDRSSQYCLRQGLFHPDIEILLNAGIAKVEGQAGEFLITLDQKSTRVDKDLCTGCGLCEQACPVEVENEFYAGLSKRKAIYAGNLTALAGTYIIDRENCTGCGACVEKCPSGAINLATSDEMREIEVGAIILATGFEEFDPVSATQYGYQRYPDVMTSIELERLLSGGTSAGGLLRPSSGKIPGSVAFVQCVGARCRDKDYCSSTCCMQAIKEAVMLKEASPGIDITIYHMDIRAFGKGYYRYYEQARDKYGIGFVRCRIPTVKQDFRTKELLITAITDGNKLITNRFDLVVLSVAQTPSPEFREVCRRLGISANKWGFGETRELYPLETDREGIYICGSASGPKDIAETVMESTAAAGKAVSLIMPIVSPPTVSLPASEHESGTAVFICNCEGQISPVLDVPELVEFSREIKGVIYAEEHHHLCLMEAQKHLADKLKEKGANRLILAACGISGFSELAMTIPVEVVNIRELARVHKNEGEAATQKAKKMVAMAREKLRWRESVPPHAEPVTPKALVIGGGLAGLTAVLAIAGRGFEVELVEKSNELGGNAGQVYSLPGGESPREYLTHLIETVTASSRIHISSRTEVTEVTGYAGNYRCALANNESESRSVEVGSIIVATGANGLQPAEYLFGQAEQVITQQELEERLFSGKIAAGNLKSVVMIQCVGSAEKGRPYCSRICCSQALKNALALKRHNPEIEIVIFYRNLITYGFKETYYTMAREEGILFIRYDTGRKPEITLNGKDIQVRATEPATGGRVVISPDLVVLSPAITPANNAKLAQILGVELTEDGFFKEAEAGFRPVDFPKGGIFVCGLAHSPRDMAETIVQAEAAAQRAASLLARSKLTSGRMVSRVNERWCSGCELCIRACPYDARVKDLRKGVVQVREPLCRGCGACVTACPSGAASLRELPGKQVFAMIDALL